MQTTMSLQEEPREGERSFPPKSLVRRPDCAAANLRRMLPEMEGTFLTIAFLPT